MVDIVALQGSMDAYSNSVTGMINMISGGAFSRLSIFAMSITPYITASIVIQLLAMVIPSLDISTALPEPDVPDFEIVHPVDDATSSVISSAQPLKLPTIRAHSRSKVFNKLKCFIAV